MHRKNFKSYLLLLSLFLSSGYAYSNTLAELCGLPPKHQVDDYSCRCIVQKSPQGGKGAFMLLEISGGYRVKGSAKSEAQSIKAAEQLCKKLNSDFEFKYGSKCANEFKYTYSRKIGYFPRDLCYPSY